MDYTSADQFGGSTELVYLLPVVTPFEVATQFYTMQFESLTKGFIDEPFIMMPHITCTSPWAIDIIDSSIELVSEVA